MSIVMSPLTPRMSYTNAEVGRIGRSGVREESIITSDETISVVCAYNKLSTHLMRPKVLHRCHQALR